MEREERKQEFVLFTLLGLVAGLALGWIVSPCYGAGESQSDVKQIACSPETSNPKETPKENKNVKVRKVFVIAENDAVMRGTSYTADIIVADVDTTLHYVSKTGEKEIVNNKIRFFCGAVGTHQYKGVVHVTEADGSVSEYPFTKEYTVTEPFACVSTTFLLKGKDNPISVSIPGISSSDIDIKVKNAQCKKTGTGYLLKPNPDAKTCVVAVFAQIEGRKRLIANREFQVVE